MGVKKFNRLESAQKIHVSRGGCVMHVQQFLVVISWVLAEGRPSLFAQPQCVTIIMIVQNECDLSI